MDKALGELTVQCNALCGLFFIYGNIETERRPSIVLNKGSDRFLPRVKVTGSFYMSTRVSYFILKREISTCVIAYNDTNFLNLYIILMVPLKDTRSLIILQFL